MQKTKDEKGKKYGKLLVLFEAEKPNSSRQTRWVCRCDCGKTAVVVGSSLRRGSAQSCGCLRVVRARRTFLKKRQLRRNTNALDRFDEDIL